MSHDRPSSSDSRHRAAANLGGFVRAAIYGSLAFNDGTRYAVHVFSRSVKPALLEADRARIQPFLSLTETGPALDPHQVLLLVCRAAVAGSLLRDTPYLPLSRQVREYLSSHWSTFADDLRAQILEEIDTRLTMRSFDHHFDAGEWRALSSLPAVPARCP